MTEPGTQTVMVVDDEKSVLTLASAILKREGFQVIAVSSAMAGLDVLDQSQAKTGRAGVSVVLCDWKMPSWDGLRMLTEFRARPFGDVPFILMSGAVSPEKLEQMGEDADGILVKPIDEKVLVEKIRKCIRMGRKIRNP